MTDETNFAEPTSTLIQRSEDVPTDPLLTPREVAQYFKIDEETVRLMARDGKLPAIKIGRLWRFRKSSIQQYLENRQNIE